MKYFIKLSWLICICAANIFGQTERLSSQSADKMVIEFRGNKIFSTEQLLKQVNLCLAQYPSFKEEFNLNTFNYCLRIAQGFIRDQGYLQSTFGKSNRQKTKDGLKITVPVEEGIRYRIAEIKIEGSKILSAEQLLAILNLKTGDIAKWQVIEEWLFERVQKIYADKGYIQSFFEIEPDYKLGLSADGEGTVDIKITIDEGQPVTIRKIEFVGNENIPNQLLRQTLLINENEIFNQALFDESIKKLNELNLLEWVDKNTDINLHISKNAKQELNIKIRVREKSKQ